MKGLLARAQAIHYAWVITDMCTLTEATAQDIHVQPYCDNYWLISIVHRSYTTHTNNSSEGLVTHHTACIFTGFLNVGCQLQKANAEVSGNNRVIT